MSEEALEAILAEVFDEVEARDARMEVTFTAIGDKLQRAQNRRWWNRAAAALFAVAVVLAGFGIVDRVNRNTDAIESGCAAANQANEDARKWADGLLLLPRQEGQVAPSAEQLRQYRALTVRSFPIRECP